MTTTIILSIISIWTTFAIILPSLIMPNFLLRKSKQQTSPYIQQVANQLKGQSKLKTLRNTFNFVIVNYTGEKEKYKLAPLYYKLFNSNIEEFLKNKNSFLACHQQNLLISNLLKETGLFTDEDIEKRHNITKFLTVHQYLIVKINNQKFKIDPFYKKFKTLKYAANTHTIWQKLKTLSEKSWNFGKRTIHLENH